MSIFKQKKAKLYNETIIKENDMVAFINSDGDVCNDVIRRRKYKTIHADSEITLKKGTLYFWNACFNISDYKNAFILKEED